MKFPPAEFIRDEITARGWSPQSLAGAMGMQMSRVEELLAGRRIITRLDAVCLGKALGTSPEVWLNLQKDFLANKRTKP